MKKGISILLSIVLMLSFVSCTQQDTGALSKNEIVEIPILARNAGNDSGTVVLKHMIEGFDKEFEGKYKLKVEWLPGVAEDIRAKLKMLNASSDLPAIVTDLAAEPAFADLLMKNNRLVDLKPYFDASPEWQEVCLPESVEYNTVNGKMYSTPGTTNDYVGIFYNKEHFEKAGISETPKTWDEFWDVCEKLEAAGYTPLSLHTTETGWCSMLLATSSLATSEAGQSFMMQKYPTDYNTPEFIDAMNVLKRSFEYATSDAVGGNYALAANNFCAEKTSMIPNGPWMIPSLSDPQFSPEGFEEKVGYMHYPEGVMISNLGINYGEGVSMDHPIEVQEGAIEYLKFKARPENIRFVGVMQGAFSPAVPLTEEDLEQLSPTMKDYAKSVSTLKYTLINYQGRWDPITQNEVIPTELVNFITGKITVEDLINKMSEAGKKYAADNQ